MDRKRFFLGLALLVFMVLLFISFAGFSEVDTDISLSSFSSSHPLGTDIYGRDFLSRLSLGALISMTLALVITLISVFLGVLLSFLMAGSGIVSFFSWLLSDSIKSISSIILSLFLSSIFGPGFLVLIVSIGISHIPDIARTSYSRIKMIENEDFVLYARAEGMSRWEIALFHVIPHMRGEVLSQALSIFSSSILTEASLSFLGAGIPVLYPSIGSILSEGRLLMLTRPSYVIIPSSVLFLISLSLHLMHEGLEPDS